MHNKLPQDLLQAFQDKQLIPVVGAGVSMSLTDEAGKRIFPSWGELLYHAAEELKDEGKEKLSKGIEAMVDLGNFQIAANYAREGLTGGLWNQFFRKYFEDPVNRISEGSMALPREIWKLGNRVVTLNYDRVLRNTCPDSGRLSVLDNSNKSELADFKRGASQTPAVWHFHGRVDNISTLIFTAESYDKLYAETDENYQAALAVFKGLCCDQRLIFIGCSLEDAELMSEMAKQHQLFEGNTGPHYALVHEDSYDAVKEKINGLPVELIAFEAFGDPLVKVINDIANHRPPQQSSSHHRLSQQSSAQQLKPVMEEDREIALLFASPLDNGQQYAGLMKTFNKIACPIDCFSLSVDNLNNLQGYDYLFILSKVIKDKLLIEDDHLCSRRISFQELEDQIGNEQTAGLFILVDQLPDPVVTSELSLPTLILGALGKKQAESFVFQMFKKNNLEYFTEGLVLNRKAFELRPLTGKIQNNIRRQKTLLPDSIDPKTVRNFIGRAGDLEQICRKLFSLEEEGGMLTIKGAGGIGKTSTVKKITVALAERAYFEGGIFFVDCEAITDSQQFKYKVAGAFNLEQAEDLRQHLRDHHDQQPRLILLDNFETLLYLDDHLEIKALVGFISDYATMMITSRERLNIEGESVYEMRQFTTDEAVELFKSGMDDRIISAEELVLLRQEIIETLLDNNPLAIKLITGNMPKGKSFEALKKELETDLFSKISDHELAVFDDSSDLNIARKKSIYGSILYSYNHLLENEKRAFELLSLFPDGIEFETLKRLTQNRKNSKKHGDTNVQQTIITDKVIKALENKSMIESNSGSIKLQSIVGKFADAQLRKRDNLSSYYHNAFKYNCTLIQALRAFKKDNEKDALMFFNSQQGNFLKSITYCDKTDVDGEELADYLESVSNFFTEICSLGGLIRELTARADSFIGREKQCVDMMLLYARYFDGDFDAAFAGVKQLIPIEALTALDRTIESERILANYAASIYSMEGEALFGAQYDKKQNRIFLEYPGGSFYLGEYNKQLADYCRQDFFSLEVLANMELLKLGTIDVFLAGLYDKSHLDRMQVSYVRSKLVPLGRQEIETLVTVNPYTRGLKGLMLAFVEEDIPKAGELYRQAITQLGHIKYYYVEALYLYAKFLKLHNQAEFDRIHDQGQNLAKKHHYRFLQYCFEELLHPTGMAYDSINYPLPDNEDFTDYIQFLIKENKQSRPKK